MRALLLALLLLPSMALYAVQPPQLSLSYDELFKIMMDNPTAMHLWSRDQLDKGQLPPDSQAWAKALAIYITTCMETGCDEDPYATDANLRKAIAIAAQGDDKPMLIRMYLMLDGINTDSGADVTDFRKALEPIKKLAEENGGGRLLADVYREYAAAAESESNLQQALSYAKDALVLAEQYGYPGDILPILIKNDSAILTGRMGDEEQSVHLYEQVIEYCQREKVRHMGAIALINLGRHYTRKENPENVKKGLRLFDQAEVLMRGLNQDRLSAFSQLTRGEALLNLKDYDKALYYIDQALAKFKGLDSAIWTADSLHWKARVLLGQKRWTEALETIEQSDALFPEHLQDDKAQLARERAQALSELGRHAEAYRWMQTFIEIHQRIDEKNKKDQLNELQVKLGYQLQEQENRILKKDNEIKEHQLREADLIKKVAVALTFLILLSLVLLCVAMIQGRRTRQAKARIQHILDNIEEGIITVGRDLRVESSLSPYLDHVIGHDAPDTARQNVMLYLLEKSDLKADEKQTLRDVITSCVDESALVWELNAGNLPQRLSLDQGRQLISLHWQPLYGKDQKIKRIIIAMRDITKQHQLEQEVGEARAQRGRLQHIMEEIARLPLVRFQSFIRGAAPRVETIRKGAAGLQGFLPELHGLKGEARTLGLRDLASITHQLEDLLDARHQPAATEAEIKAKVEDWLEVWADYEKIATLIGSRAKNTELEPGSLLQILAEQWPSIQKHCAEQGIPLHRIRMDEQIFEWNPDLQKALREIVLHSLINSIDHGFKGQSETLQPELFIQLQRNARGQIVLSIQDNGRGLNWTRLQQLIEERKFVPGPGQTLADVVFLEGLSTAEKISQTSGRGVGLAAIRKIAQDFHGDVHIKDRDNQPGCELLIELTEAS
jgi:tetratricopeptide (TPR) repeat protein/HPt (histidine-containing phosphotransfer) domain-containing protein